MEMALQVIIIMTRLLCILGMSFWMKWQLDFEGEYCLNTGPTSEVRLGEVIEWDMYSKQGVHLFQEDKKAGSKIQLETIFEPQEGDLKFSFH